MYSDSTSLGLFLAISSPRSAMSRAPQARLQDVGDLMGFMFGTGLRIGEALGLAEDAVDLETGRPARLPITSGTPRSRTRII